MTSRLTGLVPVSPPDPRAVTSGSVSSQRGSVSLKTGFGEIEIGIHAGTAARLDVSTQFGHVRNLMDAASAPGRPTRSPRCARAPVTATS